MIRELLWAMRSLRRERAASVAAVVSLSVGIGFNIATFSYVNAVLLRPFPFERPDSVVVLWGSISERERPSVNAERYEEWRARSLTVSSSAPFQLTPRVVSIGTDGTDAVKAGIIGRNLFDVLGVRAFIGSNLSDLKRADSDRAVILSHSLWSARYRSDPAVIGTSIVVEGQLREIVGVAPQGFFFPTLDVNVWLPILPDEPFQVVARLREGRRLEDLRSELTATAENRTALGAFPYRMLIVGNDERPSLLLFGIVILLLFTACANVSLWLLGRAAVREREIAIRKCLGAGFLKIAAVGVAEATVLVGLAGVLSFGVAQLSLLILKKFGGFDIPRLDGASLDVRVLVYALLSCVVVAIVASLAPAVAALSNRGLLARLFLSPNIGIAGRRSRVMRSLVAVEIAAASVLLVVSGLLTRSFVQSNRIDWGFNPQAVVVSEITVPPSLTADRITYNSSIDHLLTSLRGISGVQAAAVANGVPLRLRQWTPIQVSARGVRRDAGLLVIGDAYFDALQISILEGREFTPDDGEAAPRVAVVSSGFARIAWPGRSALGEQLAFLRVKPAIAARLPRGRIEDREGFRRLMSDPNSYEQDGLPWTIVGVVGDVRMFASGESSSSMIYTSHRQWADRFARPSYIVRVKESNVAIARALSDRVAIMLPGARVDSTFTMQTAIAGVIGASGSVGLLTFVSVALVILALVLEVTGVYSVSALCVARRRKELAVRRALGAETRTLIREVLALDVFVILVATSGGLVVGWWCSAFVEGILGESSTSDEAVYLLAAGTAFLAALAALLKPLLTAAREAPAHALRAE